MSSAVDERAPPAPVIYGLAGDTLTASERDFFKDADPLGFILFARNCREPAQVKKLTAALRDSVNRDAPVLIDQEGGRVQRLKPPYWTDTPAARGFGDNSANLQKAMDTLSRELTALGINVDCAPVLDVLFPDTHDAIGDRAYSADPAIVAARAAVVCEIFLKNGVTPVLKHMPGQGRAASDSHHDLPVVSAELDDLEKTDFAPFRAVLSQIFCDALWGMVAHVVYERVDPGLPASCSRRVVYDIIRKSLNFQGLLLSDDIGMGALSVIGDMGRRTEQILGAGCDIVLHCSGKMDEMQLVAARAQKMTNQAVTRYNRSVSYFNGASPALAV